MRRALRAGAKDGDINAIITGPLGLFAAALIAAMLFIVSMVFTTGRVALNHG